MDMAAALLKMLIGDTLEREDEVENFHFDIDKDDSRMVRLFINIGKKDKIKPSNILGAISRRIRYAREACRCHRYDG